jgi:hypothetical protein
MKLDAHVILVVEATRDDLDAEQALTVVGILARLALNVSGALEATAQDHKCRGRLYRDDDTPDAEVVDAYRNGGCCDAFLIDPETYNAARDRGDYSEGDFEYALDAPTLAVHVPANREKSWTAYLHTAIDNLIERDRALITAEAHASNT